MTMAIQSGVIPLQSRPESELYQPVKNLFEEQGYVVRGEVEGCDLVALRQDDFVIVELKAAFNLELVLQGIDRQRSGATVYVAVETPRRVGGRWKELQHLCRRLGLGLIVVSFTRNRPLVQVVCEPATVVEGRLIKQRRSLIEREFRSRSGDFNQGGVNRRPIVTAYRESALWVAAYLQPTGAASTKAIRTSTGVENAASFLQSNVYGWFERVERGVYRLTSKGEEALTLYADVVARPQGTGREPVQA